MNETPVLVVRAVLAALAFVILTFMSGLLFGAGFRFGYGLVA